MVEARNLLEERPNISGMPWGSSVEGGEVADVNGKVMRAVLLELEDLVFEQTLAEVAERDSAQGAGLLSANENVYEVGLAFVERLEERMPSNRFDVSRDRLLNEWNHYSYEFFFSALALATDMARTDDFVDRLGPRCWSPAMIAMIRPFSLDQVVGMYPRLAGRLISRTDLRVEELRSRSAVMTLRTPRELGEALKGRQYFVRRNICALHRSVLAQLPVLLKGLPPMEVVEESCQAWGHRVCRWNLRWRQRRESRLGPGVAAGSAAGALGAWLMTTENLLYALPALLLPIGLGVAVDQISGYRRRIAERIAVVREQVAQFENQYAQLQGQNAELQAHNVELEDKVRRRTADLERARRKLEQQASTDALTGLWNRHYFQQFADRESARAKRYQVPLSAIMIDVDHFKHYNDTNGHQQGDEVLRRVALLLKNNLREVDAVARYGGEEFVVILPDTGLIGAMKAAGKLRRAIEQHAFPYGDQQPLGRVTASFGVSSLALKEPEEGVDQAVGRADASLYASKEFGRNRVSVSIRDYLAWQLPRILAEDHALLVIGITSPDLKANVRERVLTQLQKTLASSFRNEDVLGVSEEGWWQVVMQLGDAGQSDGRLMDLKNKLKSSLYELELKEQPKLVVRGVAVSPTSHIQDPDRVLRVLQSLMDEATREQNESPPTAVMRALTE